jgi:hypothetical protein
MHPLLTTFRSFRIHASRLREPLVQVWLMTGMALILVIMGHVHAVRQSGDRKNPDTLSAVRLLTAGPNFQWSDNFAPATPAGARPALALVVPDTSASSDGPKPAPLLPARDTPALDWRAGMTAAASRPWAFLGKEQRQFIGRTDRPADGLTVRLAWSGGLSGNAALNHLEAQRLGKSEAPCFVVGNGSRSPDGGIELTAESLPGEGSVAITLIGTPESITGKQQAALGELLNYLEARFGTVECQF